MSYMPNIHIKGDKNAFLSKRSIDKFKDSIKNIKNNEIINESIQEIIKKYIKEGYTVNISMKENNIFFDIFQTSQKSNTNVYTSYKSNTSQKSKYLELKINELRQKRLSNAQLKYSKEKLIKSNNEDDNKNKIKKVIEEYEKIKKLTKNPILNPIDVYKNKDQYKNIIKELHKSFGENNPFGLYYKLLLDSL